MTLVPDYHLHTRLCKHAKGSPMDYAREAYKKDIPEICFCDHMPSFDNYDSHHRMGLQEFGLYLEMIGEAKEASPVPVLMGIEADYYPGCENFLEKWLSQESFDVVLGSVHFLDGWGFDDPMQLPVWEMVDLRDTWGRYFDLVQRLIGTGLFDVVAHLDLPKKFGHRLLEEELMRLVEPVLDRISLSKMTLELNTSGLRKPIGEVYPSLKILQEAAKRDIPICFGSDAHSPDEVGWEFGGAISLAREAGIREYACFKARKRHLKSLPLI